MVEQPGVKGGHSQIRSAGTRTWDRHSSRSTRDGQTRAWSRKTGMDESGTYMSCKRSIEPPTEARERRKILGTPLVYLKNRYSRGL